ncbi:MAG TPA: methylated-DNA--[protein]-cysteine S-methyltransferase [Mycobacteriales bacterium]|nr:methylated-DNA--[protein]-cysteine S-methyltransferase [Mycobacteriales bacterium]
MSGESYAIAETVIGPVGIVWGPDGVRGVQLPERTAAATRDRMLKLHPDAQPATPPESVQHAIDGISALVEGRPDDLRDIEVDLADVPEFDRKVYALARECGPGQTTTYGEIAGRLGDPGAARAVGQALGHNPVPLIVPCHRVLAAGGRLGGFSARGGVTTKLRLLDIEGAEPGGQPALF